MPAYSHWIKMRTDLLDDVRVLRVSALIGERKHTVLGLLFDLWRWADSATEDGTLPGIDAAIIDAQVGQNGFAEALVAVDWLTISPEGACVPRFDTHNGDSARKRAKHAERTALRRMEREAETENSQGAHNSRTGRAQAAHLEKEKEKEREEENPPVSLLAQGDTPPASPDGAAVPASEPAKRPTKRITGPGNEPEIPPSMDTPAFRSAWDAWLADLAARRHKPTARAAAAHMATCIEAGPHAAVQMIDLAIEKGWRKPYPRDEFGTGTGKAAGEGRDLVAEERARLQRKRMEAEAMNA